MRRAGYTVAEVMAAMLIVGLAFVGLLQGLRTIGAIQGRAAAGVAQGQGALRARAAMTRFLRQPGPDGEPPAERLAGGGGEMTLACRDAPCRLWIDREGAERVLAVETGSATVRHRLPGMREPMLRYLTSEGERDAWPLPPPSDALLTAVVLVEQGDGAASPVATARLWSEQPQDCAFDTVTAKCRLSP
jgi:hypothetical protein